MKSFLDWYAGKGLAQDMMPGLTIAFRELLISGTCGTCFDKMFKPEEDAFPDLGGVGDGEL